MVEAAPPASFIVAKPGFLLELLIVALDAPAQLGKINQPSEADVLRQCREPIFGWLRFPLGPLDQQPFRLQFLGDQFVMSDADAYTCEARGQPTAEPSRHLTVRQACFGRPSATSLAEIRSGSSRRPVLFSGLPFRLGPAPDRH